MKADKKNIAGRETKPHIGIFGRCNSGKSSLLNFILQSDSAITSPEKGTTTDVVRKSFEIIDFAPVVFIDTPGIDDDTSLSEKRLERVRHTLDEVDLAVIVFRRWTLHEQQLSDRLQQLSIPYIMVFNSDVSSHGNASDASIADISIDVIDGGAGQRDALIDLIKTKLPAESYRNPLLFEGKIGAGENILLVCPIDTEAPAGRLILPQVQAIRELLDKNVIATIVQPPQIAAALNIRPKLVVCDSQVYAEVRSIVPSELEVTTFSILLAAAKGDIELYNKGLDAIDHLKEGDRILISESCSHQVSCEDIGRVKIPMWLEKHTGVRLDFTVVSGNAPLPENLGEYSLMIQCGGCMVTRTQIRRRILRASQNGVPVTNYGMLIRKIRS